MPTIEDLKDSSGLWVKSFNQKDAQYMTKSFQMWRDMVRRCDKENIAHRLKPAYEGCSVAGIFLDFQQFTDWHSKQIGYGLSNYDLDKDILCPGNRVYSEYTCALVPSTLNYFFRTRATKEVDLPMGVGFHKGKIRAIITIDRKQKHLGYFSNVELAQCAYLKAKKEEALRWCERLMNKEFLVDQKVIDALYKWGSQ